MLLPFSFYLITGYRAINQLSFYATAVSCPYSSQWGMLLKTFQTHLSGRLSHPCWHVQRTLTGFSAGTSLRKIVVNSSPVARYPLLFVIVCLNLPGIIMMTPSVSFFNIPQSFFRNWHITYTSFQSSSTSTILSKVLCSTLNNSAILSLTSLKYCLALMISDGAFCQFVP